MSEWATILLFVALIIVLPVVAWLSSRGRPQIKDTNPDYPYPEFDPMTVAFTVNAIVILTVFGFLYLSK